MPLPKGCISSGLLQAGPSSARAARSWRKAEVTEQQRPCYVCVQESDLPGAVLGELVSDPQKTPLELAVSFSLG